MKDTKKVKLIGGIAAVGVVLAIAVAVILSLNGGNEVYRDISVFELNASASVTRDGVALDAYQGMRLEDGDSIKVSDDGYIRLLLDNDKYVTLEAGTEILLHATGNSADSLTKIELVQGAVLNELDTKLSSGSSYELSTPTSVMAVRGTVFRAAMTKEGEACNVELMVLDGQVAAATVLADGSVSTEEILVNAGAAADFDKPDPASDPVYTPAEIDYEALPADTLALLLEICESGRKELSVSAEDLERIYTQKTAPSQEDQKPANDSEPQTKAPEASTSPSGSASTESGSAAGTTASTPESKPAPSGQQAAVPKPPAGTSTGTKPSGSKPPATTPSSETAESVSPEPEDSEDEATEPSEDGSTGTEDGNPGGSTGTQPPEPGQTTPPAPSVPPTPPTGGADGDNEEQPGKPDTDDPGTQEPDEKIFTVTFLDASGKPFGIQYVTGGSRAMKPFLNPAGGSAWCDEDGNVFDFDTIITENITLYYR